MKNLNPEYKETAQARHRNAKDNIKIVIDTLRYQRIIDDNTYGMIVKYLSDIAENPFELIVDFAGKSIDIEIAGQLTRFQITEQKINVK